MHRPQDSVLGVEEVQEAERVGCSEEAGGAEEDFGQVPGDFEGVQQAGKDEQLPEELLDRVGPEPVGGGLRGEEGCLSIKWIN